MRDAALEILRRAPFGVHVMREKIACLAGVNDDVGFGDRASHAAAREADAIILEKLFLDHGRLVALKFIYLRAIDLSMNG